MMTTYHPDIELLRQAAHQREWTTLQDTFKRIIALLEPIPALEAPAQRIHAHLPRFESYYPEATWVRELAMTVMAYASAPSNLPDHAVNQFPMPGCGNFLNAVLDLARAVQPEYTLFERYSFITNATANVILAELMDHYYQDKLDLWQDLVERGDEWLDEANGIQRRHQIYAQFWLDASVAEKDIAAWLSIADLLEERLHLGYS